jgi:hypothetical protein
MAARQHPRMEREVLAAGDGQALDHAASSSSPRVTVNR